MLSLKNSKNNYGFMAMALHWIMAVMILCLIALGWYMVSLPIGIEKLKLFGWHKEWGVLVLILVVIRLTWRLVNLNPSLAILPVWEKLAARSVHWLFYVLMFAVPMTGWMMSSASGLPVSFFGLFVLPDLVSPNEASRLSLLTLHKWLAYGLLATIFLHTSAAFKHHFFDKDDILRRMLP